MKKLAFVLGLGVGFILGSKAGPEAYEQLEGKVRSLRHRPEVESAVDRGKETAKQATVAAQDKATEVFDKFSESPTPTEHVTV
jgi:hypothetical protein